MCGSGFHRKIRGFGASGLLGGAEMTLVVAVGEALIRR